MKNKKITLLLILLFSITTNAQITKGNWMMGGYANFGNYKNTNYGNSNEITGFGIAPNVGYFIIDKLTIGTSGQLYYQFPKSNEKSYPTYGISPFIKYYFLEKEKTINIFSELSYELIKNTLDSQQTDKFKFKAGTVFFLNSSVGLEVALNYSKQNTTPDYQNRSIYMDVGFQIHLEKK